MMMPKWHFTDAKEEIMRKQELKETQKQALNKELVGDRRLACMNLKRTCSGLDAGKCRMTKGSCVFQGECEE